MVVISSVTGKHQMITQDRNHVRGGCKLTNRVSGVRSCTVAYDWWSRDRCLRFVSKQVAVVIVIGNCSNSNLLLNPFKVLMTLSHPSDFCQNR